MEIQFEDFLSLMANYLSTTPSEMLAGNVFAVATGLILVYIAVFIINKFTGLIIFFLKKIFLTIIVSVAFYQFLLHLNSRIAAEGLTNDILVLGAAGFLVGILAFLTALYASFRSFKKVRKGEIKKPGAYEKPKEYEKPAEVQAAAKEKHGERSFKEMLSIDSIKSDKSLGAVIAYIVIAEFGVFSSKTIAAPTVDVGLMFFIAFMIVAVFFIKQSYKDYKKGLFHFAVACVVGGALSILLGHLWGAVPLEQLLSAGYFATDSLVAFVTGLALSLFMGSR
ncbi:MAG: hypothetical protein A7316_07240 [Candidatus Altiarchaeales archaeon WOR_SM1_86-2]|nr:MAG: hypothetical protein A7315_12045 [Candidatus Altiarchaeales archaeon WOR_SM1_79]ODS38741.1 MAG: hypothetical protein A7316_07240 [Candidatus Altiarchaeales archaeon WOR_SM1_86-2]